MKPITLQPSSLLVGSAFAFIFGFFMRSFPMTSRASSGVRTMRSSGVSGTWGGAGSSGSGFSVSFADVIWTYYANATRCGQVLGI